MRLSQSDFAPDFQCTTHNVHILKLHHRVRVQSVENNVILIRIFDKRRKCFWAVHHHLIILRVILRESVVTLHFINL